MPLDPLWQEGGESLGSGGSRILEIATNKWISFRIKICLISESAPNQNKQQMGCETAQRGIGWDNI